jgi:hypothetical protein
LGGKYFFKNISLLNVLLISVIVFMAYYALFPLMGAGIKYTLPTPGKTVPEKPDRPEGLNHLLSSSYTIIADNNLFHPERKIPLEKKAADQQQPPLPKPDLVLYGTIISDTLRLAYLEDLKAPRNTPGRGRRQTGMKIGDTLSGFTLKEIDTDKIVMTMGEEKMTVYVHDPLKLKTREGVVTQPHAAPGQAPVAASRVSPTLTPPSAQSLIKPSPPPKTRARTTRTDDKVLDVFRRLPP